MVHPILWRPRRGWDKWILGKNKIPTLDYSPSILSFIPLYTFFFSLSNEDHIWPAQKASPHGQISSRLCRQGGTKWDPLNSIDHIIYNWGPNHTQNLLITLITTNYHNGSNPRLGHYIHPPLKNSGPPNVIRWEFTSRKQVGILLLESNLSLKTWNWSKIPSTTSIK